MLCIVTNHARFNTLETVEKQVKSQKQKYDDYDIGNDKEATQFLLNSLDPDLEEDLAERIEEEDLFPVVFIRLVNIIRSQSLHRIDDLKTELRSIRPSHFASPLVKSLSPLQRFYQHC